MVTNPCDVPADIYHLHFRDENMRAFSQGAP